MIDLNLPDDELMAKALASAQSRPGFCLREDWLKKMNQLMGT
jgi:hypothetical protein